MISVRSLVLNCAAWSLLALSASNAQPPTGLSAPIESQPLGQALSEFAAQTGLQVVYVSGIAATQVSKGAELGLTPRDALDRLLDGTGLAFEFVNDRTVRIFAPAVHDPARSTDVTSSLGQAQPRSVRLAVLEEVVVTARRREEPLSNVPISAAVWTEEAMEASGVKGIDEIGALTPGVEFEFDSRFGDYFTNIVIRGVTDMHGTTTGVFLDDTPLPPGRGETFLRAFPLTFDLDRVEVLRGPQGGLLGQDALGGTVRFVINEPSLKTSSGLVRTEFASPARGDPSYEVGAAAGGPLIPDVLGYRVSGWYRSDGGYVDRIDRFTGQTIDDNANETVSKTFRGALTWAPTDSVRITPSLTYQSIGARDVSSFHEELSDPQNGELISGSQIRQPFEDKFSVGSLKITAGFSSLDLSAVTSYLHRSAAVILDLSPYDYLDPTPGHSELQQTVLSHEMRLTSTDPTAPLSWVAGAWFSSARIRETSGVADFGPDIDRTTVTEQTQLAAFGQIAVRVTEALTASIGLRAGRSEYDSVTEVPPRSRAADTETSVTPSFGLSYDTDERNLLYLTVAKGYRSGGIYAPVLGCGDGPVPYPTDTLWSYEFGAKSRLLDQRLNLDTSVFHIVWSNRELPPMYDCVANNYRPVSAAVSNGFNVAARAYLSDRLRFGLAIGYTDAHYTETVKSGDDVIIQDGDALGRPPGIPSPWNVTASVERDFAIASGVTASVRAEDIFHSRNPGPFYSDRPASSYYYPNRRPDPSTNVLNLRAAFAWPRFDAAIFVNNALDAQPTLMVSDNWDPVLTAATFRPRTIGVSLNWRL